MPIREVEEAFVGLSYQSEVVEKMLEKMDIAPYLGGITKVQLLEAMFS